MLADEVEDAAGRNWDGTIQLRLGGQRTALIVVGNHEGRKAAGHIDRTGRDGLRGRDALFEPCDQVISQLDLGIVGALAEHLLGNGVKGLRQDCGEAGENEGVEQQSGTRKCVT